MKLVNLVCNWFVLFARFYQKYHKLIITITMSRNIQIGFITFLAIVFLSFSNGQDPANDYMKRELSLVKPYQGEFKNPITFSSIKSLWNWITLMIPQSGSSILKNATEFNRTTVNVSINHCSDCFEANSIFVCLFLVCCLALCTQRSRPCKSKMPKRHNLNFQWFSMRFKSYCSNCVSAQA